MNAEPRTAERKFPAAISSRDSIRTRLPATMYESSTNTGSAAQRTATDGATDGSNVRPDPASSDASAMKAGTNIT